MLRYRLLIASGVGVLLAGAYFQAIGSFSPYRLNKLSKGMTVKEVEEVMGAPSSVIAGMGKYNQYLSYANIRGVDVFSFDKSGHLVETNHARYQPDLTKKK